ncbi:MAG: hypothetical protein IJ332_00300 [Clostridia bacterium]|nr:hypothetical protein [Clostridia bacterium]
MNENKSLLDVMKEVGEIVEEIKRLEERITVVKDDLEDLIIKYKVKFICD